MQLRVRLPFKVFADVENVTRIVITTPSGSFGLLPNRLDCTAALSPGLLTYSTQNGAETHLALDEGVLIKAGADVLVCVRRAIGGADLGRLRRAIEQEFLSLSEQDRAVRATLAHLESGFIRRLVELQRA
jgi:F-type H+-transporting ATPase subunit epsilon